VDVRTWHQSPGIETRRAVHLHSSDSRLPTGRIHFPNGNEATWAKISVEAESHEVLRALGLKPPRALILLLGGTEGLEPGLTARLRQLFGRGIACAAMEAGAVILDGGTQAGIVDLMGQGVAGRGHGAVLVGVVPEGLVTWPGGPSHPGREPQVPLEPHHSHFVLVDSHDWGGETPTLYKLAETLAAGAPVVAVLANGGELSKQELLRAVRRGWPVVVLKDSGRLADALSSHARQSSGLIEDPVLAEIVADGDLHFFPLEGSPRELKRQLTHQLREDSILRLAWQRFALYDDNAKRQQRVFRRIQRWTVLLGFLGTLAALLKTSLHLTGRFANGSLPDDVFRVLIVALAAAVTGLVAAASYFKSGTRWILLRAHTEALKREIYRYRCRLGTLAHPRAGRLSNERRLASRMRAISQQLIRTESNVLALGRYRGRLPPEDAVDPRDDGFSALSPFHYIRYRLEHQLGYYRDRLDTQARRARRLQGTVIAASALGTVLAAVGLELWVALTSALVMTLIAWINSQNAENLLTKYNQAITDLEDTRAWWSALSLEEQSSRRNFDILVSRTELVLQSELTGWVREMKELLARLDARHEKSGKKVEPRVQH
jgi:TRPM family ion channel/conflict system pore-forming effector with SLATT domain/uncharacterized protein DUF4231